MYNKDDIQTRLNKLIDEKSLIKRFYHFRSIQNFIHFFDELESIQLKEKVYSTLMEYLDIVNKDPIEDIHQCTQLFDQYIRPVGNLYEETFGFMPVMSLWVIIFCCIALFSILYIFNLSLILYFVIGVIVLCYYFYLLKKKMDKKVYGLKW